MPHLLKQFLVPSECLAFVRDVVLLVHAVKSDALNVITAIQCVLSLEDTSVVLDNVCELLASLNGQL